MMVCRDAVPVAHHASAEGEAATAGDGCGAVDVWGPGPAEPVNR
jgi:hypothetical protein